VQQLKVEWGILFPDARKAALAEQLTNSPRQTAASVVSTANSSIIQSKRKQTATVSVQTELTWPVKVNSQSTQTTSQQKKHPVLRLHREAAKLETMVKAVRGTLTPNRPLHLQRKVENQKSTAPFTY